MPTTPQGIDAEKHEDELSEKFKTDVLWVLKTQGPTKPHMLHPYLKMVPGYSEDIVREAMWRLLHEKTIELQQDRHLVLVINPIKNGENL